jgi:hypothetical protein
VSPTFAVRFVPVVKRPRRRSCARRFEGIVSRRCPASILGKKTNVCGHADMSLKRGQELFDEDDGRRWLVYKKQRRHLTQPYAEEAGSYAGYYYYPAGVEVTSSNWADVCEWTVEEQVLLWAQAAFDGDGLTAEASKQASSLLRTNCAPSSSSSKICTTR